MQEHNYRMQRGEIFERLVIVKDRRTHRLRVPWEAEASVLVDDVAYVIPVTVNYEGGVRLYLTPEQTNWFEDGEYRWDMAAVISRSHFYTSTPLGQVIAVGGTITVFSYDNISPLDSDGETDPLDAVA